MALEIDEARKILGCNKKPPNLAPLVREISLIKNIVIMEKCKDNLKREFYIKMIKKYGWIKNVLVNNLENKMFT